MSGSCCRGMDRRSKGLSLTGQVFAMPSSPHPQPWGTALLTPVCRLRAQECKLMSTTQLTMNLTKEAYAYRTMRGHDLTWNQRSGGG